MLLFAEKACMLSLFVVSFCGCECGKSATTVLKRTTYIIILKKISTFVFYYAAFNAVLMNFK